MGWKFTLSFFAVTLLFSWQLSGQDTCGSTFFDLGGENGAYANNEQAEWTFCPDEAGDLVTLNFTSVAVESCCDDLAVYDGTGTGSPLNLDIENPETFTSSADDGCLTVTWSSDGSVTLAGWQASVSCAPPPPCPNPTLLSLVNATATGAVVQWNQVGNVNVWDVEVVPAGTATSGTPTNTNIMASPYTWEDGVSGTSYDLYIRGRCEDEGEFTNWVGPLTFSTNPACGDFFYDTGGENGTYQNNELETWVFCPDNPGDLVTLNFLSVAVESCCDDLMVYNGSGTGGTLLEGDLEAPASFSSSSGDGCLTVTFDSDGSVIFDGWQAAISCAPAPPCPNPTLLSLVNATSDGAVIEWTQVGNVNMWDMEIVEAGTAPTGVPTITDITASPYTWDGGESGTDYEIYLRGQCEDEGEFTNWVGPLIFRTNPACGDLFFDSGGADGEYQVGESQTWVFCPDNPGDQVTLAFLSVDVEIFGDNLIIYNGTGTDNPLATDLESPEIFTSNTEDGCLTVVFTSDFFGTDLGWVALISCNPPPPCPNPSSLSVADVTSSGATLGWLENGDATSWNVEIVTAGTMASGTATDTGVSNPFVWEGGESGTAYEYYVQAECGFDDETSNWIGPFSFTTIPACGDSFFDPGGQNGTYDNNELVSYTFCPDTPGEFIVIDFTLVDVEGCCDDLAVYNGNNLDEPLNLDIETPMTFTSTSDNGCLTVTFDSDGSVVREGWEATIICTPCPPVFAQDISVANIAAVQADVLVNTNIQGGSFLVEVDTVGFPLGMGAMITGAGDEVTLTGLTENTDYEFYLTYICPDGQPTPALGPFFFTTIFANDIGITGILEPTDECGLSAGEPIRVEITNFGANPQTLFPLNFGVNGVLAGVSQPQDGFYTGIISRDSTEIFEFDLNYDFSLSGEYIIEVWTEMMGDSDVSNDTFTIVVTNFAPPLFEDFEAGVIPTYFETSFDNFLAAPGDHNAPSWVLSSNLFSPFDEFRLDFPVLGPIAADDTMYFDYRYVDFFDGTIATQLSDQDSLLVLVSLDCGETYEELYAISGNEHEPSLEMTLVAVPLEDYEGENIKLRMTAVYANGDYFLDVDNINIYRCEGLNLDAAVIGSMPGLDDGQITITQSGGVGPFEYVWDDGNTDAMRTDLAVGQYSVSVTDRFGCTGQLLVTVDFFVSTNELPSVISDLRLAPNPTTSQSVVNVSFTETLDAQIDVVNMLGQSVWRGPVLENVNAIQQTVDLSQVPAGIYLVRIQAAGQSVSRKLIKN